ncbi:MAG: hypothetical protein KIT34_06225 [Cyanobacteria bacterium TGS_CYA1]|nr:hypothetical protein [Cyanobacteria bacterium TGS_CYA1]
MKKDNPLDSLMLSFPCPVLWETMEGGERERLCKQCDKKVYNISDMSKKEAEAILLSSHSGDRKCVKFFLRQDGTITTDECPKFLRPVRAQYRKVVYAVSAFYAFIISIFASQAYFKTNDIAEIKVIPSVPVDPRYGQSGEVGGGLGGDVLVSTYYSVLDEGIRLTNDAALKVSLNEAYFKRTFELDLLEQLRCAYLNNGNLEMASNCEDLLYEIKSQQRVTVNSRMEKE